MLEELRFEVENADIWKQNIRDRDKQLMKMLLTIDVRKTYVVF